MTAPDLAPDLAIVGAGLSGGLLAHRLAALRPELRILVVEGGATVGGNHTWSFHEGDLTPGERAWIAPFVEHSWPNYEVRFPDRRRRFSTGYASVSSERFQRVLKDQLGSRLMTSAPVAAIETRRIVLADQSVIEAGAVIDARGPREAPHLTLGFQKFLGLELEFAKPHGLAAPIVMDASVPQSDGYRFVYCLPFSPTRMLVEDTYYADGPDMRREALQASIDTYVAAAGWGSFRIVREEEGILPIALDGDIEAHLAALGGMPTIGLAAALFHPTTGYSLPDAVRTADLVAGLPDLSQEPLGEALAGHARGLWSERGYFRMLNRLLFRAGAPEERYRILAHFHRLPDGLVSRFYAAELTPFDKLRILVGKPPVSIASALRVILKGSA